MLPFVDIFTNLYFDIVFSLIIIYNKNEVICMKKVFFVLGIIFLVAVFCFNNCYAEDIEKDKLYKGKIIKTGGIYQEEYKYQEVTVKMLDGPSKGTEYEIKYTLKILDTAELKPLDVGDKVFVIFAETEDGLTPSISDVYRLPYLIFIIVLFLALILIIGKFQGFKTIIALAVTIAVIFGFMIPRIMAGASAITTSILVSIVITIISLLLVAGFTRKSLIAILGTIFGVIVAGILSAIISSLGNITGLADCEAHMLVYVSQTLQMDIEGMLFAGILIGTVGATMDIAMSISSAMTEVLEKVPNISTKELIKSGMNVGKDAMGTMSNTLIFAYVGESLILIILLMNTGATFTEIINSDQIATEIVRGICSTIGMISAIPLTTVVFGMLEKYFPKKRKVSFEKTLRKRD